MKPFRLIGLLIVSGLGLWTLALSTKENSQQRALLEKVRGFGAVDAIAIRPDPVASKSFLTQITNSVDIAAFETGLKNADTKPIGSHNGPVYECLLVLRRKGGTELSVLGTVHKRQVEDLYVSENFYVLQKDGTYSRSGAKPVRIPQLGHWLMKKEPKGILE